MKRVFFLPKPESSFPHVRLAPQPNSQNLCATEPVIDRPLAFLLAIAVGIAVSAASFMIAVGVAHAESEAWSARDVHAAMKDASPLVRCVVLHEVGGVGFDPLAVGALGELGPVQLKPGGELERFYAEGGVDPQSPYEAVPYLERAISEGRGRAWSPIKLGLCG